MTLRPFFPYYGAKWRAAAHYPPPRFPTIVEPFAGSAGFSLRFPSRRVILVEKDPRVAATWRYLLGVSASEILSLPDIDDDQTVDNLAIAPEARLLIGWWLNAATTTPSKSPGAWMRSTVDNGGPGWVQSRPLFWGSRVRERLASQVDRIRHWTLIEADYSDAPDVEASWFVDPPYIEAGRYYPQGPDAISYPDLAAWCRARRGEVVVCENSGASWLPFRPWRAIKSARGTSVEVVWTQNVPVQGEIKL